MRRLLAFLLVAAVLLGAEALLDWWVDPFGTFWKPAALDAAIRSHCLVSEELVGNAYSQFKLDVFRHRPTRVFVTGSSRTVKIGARPGEATFTNMGMPNATPASILQLFRDIPASAPPQTVYLGVEPFWFNPSFSGAAATGWYPDLRYLVSGNTFLASLRMLRAAPWELTRQFRTTSLGGRCVIGRTDVSIAWKLDGSRLYAYELQPAKYRPQPVPFTTDLAKLDLGYYDNWSSFSQPRLATLEQALAVARTRGWRVVGFTLPNPTEVARFLASPRGVGAEWGMFERVMPVVFGRYGDRFLDLSDVRDVPCGQHAFADGTFHPDAACSRAIRLRLDRAARGR